MLLNEAIEKVHKKEYKYLVHPDKRGKWKLRSDEWLADNMDNDFKIYNIHYLLSDKWEVEEEILPQNVRRDAFGILKEHRISEVWINVYRSYIDKEIRETIHVTEHDANLKGCSGCVWEFIKTLHLSQQYSVPYVKKG